MIYTDPLTGTRKRNLRFAAMIVASTLAACQPVVTSDQFFTPQINHITNFAGAEGHARDGRKKNEFFGHRFNPAHKCTTALGFPTSHNVNAQNRAAEAAQVSSELNRTLSPGDLVELQVLKGEMFSEQYVIGPNGSLAIPGLGTIPAARQSIEHVERAIEARLVERGFFPRHAASAELVLRQLGEISISVGGSVFRPGLLNVGDRNSDTIEDSFATARGTNDWRRQLSGVLKAAGGIRPDADLTQVVLYRGGKPYHFDMRGVFTGAFVDDPVIINGDRVHVPSSGCFSTDLVRTSRITPPGIRVFLSNPTDPVFAINTTSNSFENSVPYGSRLLHALASAKCLGGTGAVNADRYAFVVGSNPLSGEPEGVHVNVEDVIRSPHRLDLNPFLQAGDAIACYDSRLTNVRDFAEVLGAAISPPRAITTLLGN